MIKVTASKREGVSICTTILSTSKRQQRTRKAFDKKLIEYKDELLQGKPIKRHQAFYERYFIVKQRSKRGIGVEVKADAVAVAKAKRYSGFFVLLRNETMSAAETLEIYRNRDVVEKVFLKIH